MGHRSTRWALGVAGALSLTTAGTARAGPAPTERVWKTFAPVPEGARVTLAVDRERWYLGETVLVHYAIENVGQEPIAFDFGSDYRFAYRELRYRVTAQDEKGAFADDPDPSGYCEGGKGGRHTLKPGERWERSLPLPRYARIDRPGTYRIRVRFDCGWAEAPGRPVPVPETTVVLATPTAEDAERILATAGARPRTPSFGERSAPEVDLATIRDPAYLAPLVRRAEAGGMPGIHGIDCIDAIGSIETVEATKALLALLGHADAGMALAALRTLNARLPDPEWRGALPRRGGPFADPSEARRRRLSERAWDASLAASVRAGVSRFAQSKDPETVRARAYALECVGTADGIGPK